jgi:WD40 repeat protein
VQHRQQRAPEDLPPDDPQAQALPEQAREARTASADRTARVWWVEGGSGPELFAGHLGEVVAAAFSPDGQRVLTTSRDGTVRVWPADGRGEPLVPVMGSG